MFLTRAPLPALRRFVVLTLRLMIAGLLLLAVGVVAVQQLAVARAERDYPPPGRLVEFGGHVSHIACAGTGTPTILLEAGLDAGGSSTWDGVFDELSTLSRVCAYDRAGMMWSEPRSSPRDASNIADELDQLLDTSGESAPLVLVGHSLGGVYARVFDQRHPGRAVGFVFVDSSHPEQGERFPQEVRDGVVDRRPEPKWYLKLRGALQMFASDPWTPARAYFWRSLPEGIRGERQALEQSLEQGQVTGPLDPRPIVVLSAGTGPSLPEVSDDVNRVVRETWLTLHRELAALSSRSAHRVVEGAGHNLHGDRPEALVQAVRDVLSQVREGASEGVPATGR